ncbi:uncharacterized protein [Palaemon carinicauda]|uniref:uncharacterized protein n=1 Tax=Palaemon carinicauda TaxID=392227 RepID=UPI0035B5DFF3
MSLFVKYKLLGHPLNAIKGGIVQFSGWPTWTVSALQVLGVTGLCFESTGVRALQFGGVFVLNTVQDLGTPPPPACQLTNPTDSPSPLSSASMEDCRTYWIECLLEQEANQISTQHH